MNSEQRGGLQDDRGTDQPAWPHEERTHAGDDAICEAEIRHPFPGPIEDQELLLEEHDSATTEPAPPGPASRAIVVSRWRRRTAGREAVHGELLNQEHFRVLPFWRDRLCGALASRMAPAAMDVALGATSRRTPEYGHRHPQLVHKMAAANPLWGAPRIHGELGKVGVAIASAPGFDQLLRLLLVFPQGDTRSAGLRWICQHGGEIYCARKRVKWPGLAAVVVSILHVMKGP